MEWINTDTLQRVLKLSENEFVVVETICEDIAEHLKDDEFQAGFLVFEVDLKEFDNEDLEKYVESYYSDLAEVKEDYGKYWKQIVAEIIAETDCQQERLYDTSAKVYNNELDVEKDLDEFLLELDYEMEVV